MKIKVVFLLSLCLAVLGQQDIKARSRQKEIPILAWYSIPPGENATEERYRELKDCGFNYSFSHIYTKKDALRALDLCRKVGMKSIFMCPELKSETEATVKQVRRHRALGGYFLRDEPQNADLEELGKWARRVEAADTKHPCYLNLLPSWAFSKSGYEEHLRLFDKQVNLPLLSFDHYPLLSKGKEIFVRAEFYENLEMISAESRRTGKPFWAFALSTAHMEYPVPTMGQLRLQMYSNLLYGAQGLQYFTYWNPSTETWDFHQAPITEQGLRSRVYEEVRSLNQEIQCWTEVFLGCRVEGVYHLGNKIPQGTKRLTTLPPNFLKIDSRGQSAMVSQLTNEGRNYVIVQNTHPTEGLCIDILTNDKVQRLRQDGTVVQASRYEAEHYLEPGMIEVYYW